MIIIIFTALALVMGAVYAVQFLLAPPKKKKKEYKPAAPTKHKKKHKKKIDITAQFKNKAKAQGRKGRRRNTLSKDSEHPSILHFIKAHTGTITGLDFSPDGRALATVSEDKSLRVWNVQKAAKLPPYTRINLDADDHATAAAFDSHGRYVAIALAKARTIQFYEVHLKHKDDARPTVELKHTFATKHKDPISTLIWGPEDSFIATCCKGQDTSIKLFSPKGQLLKTLETKQIKNFEIALSPCGQFLAAGAHLPEVKIWQLFYTKEGGQFLDAELCMSLKGHRLGVVSLAFLNKKRIVTGSMDGTWKLWNLGVRYNVGEEPKALLTQSTEGKQADLVAAVPVDEDKASVVACISGTTLTLHHSGTGQLLTRIDDAHKEFASVMQFTRDGAMLVSSGGDKNVRYWQTPSL